MSDCKQVLESAGIMLPENACQQLDTYCRMLIDWNERMDLTSVKPEDMLERHFVDSLLPLSQPGLLPAHASIIDVGTGAGFPGLPLLIACPEWTGTLLEAQGKRCTFLQAVLDELHLTGRVTLLQERAEVAGQLAAHREHYDFASARAVAPLNLLCEYLLPFVKQGGRALCWKGPSVVDEMPDGAYAASVLGGHVCAPLDLTGSGRQLLVMIDKTQSTPAGYPRKNGIPAKRPLKQKA